MAIGYLNGLPLAGTWANRPSTAPVGQPYYATDANATFYYNGSFWQHGAVWSPQSVYSPGLPYPPTLRLEPDTNAFTQTVNCPGLFTSTAMSTQCTNGQVVQAMKDWSGAGGSGTGGAGKHLRNASAQAGVTCVVQPNFDNTQPFNGRSYLSLTGAAGGNNWLQGDNAADFSFLHQGPCTVMVLLKPTAAAFNGVIFETGNVASSPGVYMYFENSGKTGSLSIASKGVGGTAGTANIALAPRGINNNAVPTGVAGIVAYNYDAAASNGKANLYYNRGLIGAPQTNCGAPSTGAAHQAMRLGDASTATLPFNGAIAFVWAWNRLLTQAELSQAHQYASMLYGVPTTNVADVGDSITAITHSGTVNGASYSTRMQNRLGGMYNVFNFGHSGDKIADTKAIVEASSATGSVPTCSGVWRNGFKIVCVGVGVNDIGNGTSGSTAWNALKVMLDELTADSVTQCVVRTLPLFKANTTFWNATTPGDVDFFNNAVIAYCAGKPTQTRAVNLQAVFAGGADSYTMPSGLSFDGLHPNQLGSDLDGNAVSSAVISLGLS